MEDPGICVVDDDPSVLRSLRELLGSDGFDAQIFDRPERFMDYASTHSVRLAVLDLWMPTQNGIELQEGHWLADCDGPRFNACTQAGVPMM